MKSIYYLLYIIICTLNYNGINIPDLYKIYTLNLMKCVHRICVYCISICINIITLYTLKLTLKWIHYKWSCRWNILFPSSARNPWKWNLRYRTLTHNQIRKYNIGLDPISARDSTNPSFWLHDGSSYRKEHTSNRESFHRPHTGSRDLFPPACRGLHGL